MTRIPVYLAGSRAELERVTSMAARLESTGLVRVTLAWFDQVAADRAAGRTDRDLNREEQRARALSCLRATEDALIFWALWPEVHSPGVACEYAFVLGREGISKFVSGPNAADCIFTALADCRTPYDDLAFDGVMSIVRALREPVSPAEAHP